MATVLIVNIFTNSDVSLCNILITSILSSLTVGGKATSKLVAVKKSNDIVYNFGKILSFIKKEK